MTARHQHFADWFFAPGPATAAVVYRALLSLWTVAFLATRFAYVDELFCRPVLRRAFVLNRWLGDPVPPVWLVQGVMALLVLLLLGFALAPWLAGGPSATRAQPRSRLLRLFHDHPRAVHLLILALLSFVFSLDMTMHRGYGSLAYLQWWLLWFAPYERLRADDGQVARAPLWGLRLVQMQFCSVYLLTVLAKLVGGSGWLDGETLYYTFHGERWGQFLLSSWDISRPLARILSIATLLSELFVGLCLWHRRARPLAMAACLAMHLAMALSLRVSLQFPTLMVLHLVLFVDFTTPCVRWPALRRHLGPRPVD